MKAWRFAKTELSPIGLDLGASAIRMLQVTREDPPRLVAAACEPLPEDWPAEPSARRQLLTQALVRLHRTGHFKGRRVVMAIPPAHMHVQHMRLSRSEDGQPDEQLHAELRKRLGIEPQHLVVRTVEVGDVFSDGTARREVICMATGRNIVLQQVQLAQRARLQVVGMHGQPLAITTAFVHLFRRADDHKRTTCFIDIGASQTKVMILHGGDLAFAKMVHVTAGQLNATVAGKAAHSAPQDSATEAMAPAADCSGPACAAVSAAVPLNPGEPVAPASGPTVTGQATAEEATVMLAERRRSGGVVPGLQTLDKVGNGTGQPVATAHNEMLDCLIDELQLCLGYHRSLYPDRPIEKLVFLGGGSSDHDNCRAIAAALGLPADLGDPLARVVRSADSAVPVGVDLRQRQGAWACALGLCLLPTDL